MFRELAELGRELQEKGELPPYSFSDYAGPIVWTVHLWPDRAVLRPSELFGPKPFSIRTVNEQANLLADEAAYSLGVSTKDDGTVDGKAPIKADKFQQLYRAFRDSDELQDADLRDSVGWLDRLLSEGGLVDDPHYSDVRTKQWVSFMPEVGALAGSHLFLHADAQVFWKAEKQRRCSETGSYGQCAVCGAPDVSLVDQLPLQVRLGARNPLHSFNKPAFTSYVSGSSPQHKAHLGVCFECGDIASRAFDYLRDSPNHYKLLVRPPNVKNDNLANQHAVFWLRNAQPVQVGNQTLDPMDVDFGALLSEEPSTDATLAQMLGLLNLPWQPRNSGLRLSSTKFFLAVLSPNVGRIALREWMSTDIERIKESLRRYLLATEIIASCGDSSAPISLGSMVSALGRHDPNLVRSLLRCAYMGVPPPPELLVSAGARFNYLLPNERELKERQRKKRPGKPDVWNESWLTALAGAVKLAKYWGMEEGSAMTRANALNNTASYHCGRLFAVLEEAQQVYSYRQHGERLKVSIIQRAYGGAAETPASVLGQLFKIASTAHLPRAGRDIQIMAETISSRIAELGGAPSRLTLPEQAEFGLGFYQQRAEIRALRDAKKNAAERAATESADQFDSEETSDGI